MSIFKRNFLPAQSQPWARQIQDRIRAFEGGVRTLDVNTRSKDEQFSAALKRLDAATINAQTSADQAQAAADAAAAASSLATTANSTAIAANSTAINANSTAITANSNALSALQSVVDLGAPGGPTINAANLTAGTITSVNISGVNISGVSLSGSTITGSDILSAGNVEVPFGTVFGDTVIANTSLFADGSLTRTQLIGGGTTGASITNGGNFVRTTSSQRYKTDIQPLTIELNDLYAVEPKTFKRIEEVEEAQESGQLPRTYPGFIAEELAGTSLDKFVFYGKDDHGNERPEGIHYPELTAALLLAIKDLNTRIEALESR